MHTEKNWKKCYFCQYFVVIYYLLNIYTPLYAVLQILGDIGLATVWATKKHRRCHAFFYL